MLDAFSPINHQLSSEKSGVGPAMESPVDSVAVSKARSCCVCHGLSPHWHSEPL